MPSGKEVDRLLWSMDRHLRVLVNILEVLHPQAYKQAIEKLVEEDEKNAELRRSGKGVEAFSEQFRKDRTT